MAIEQEGVASRPLWTPGPWFWALDSHDRTTSLMRSGVGDYVISPQADVGDYGLSVDKWNDVSGADARLIAAAPELARCLKNMINALDAAMDDGSRALLVGKINATREASRLALAAVAAPVEA